MIKRILSLCFLMTCFYSVCVAQEKENITRITVLLPFEPTVQSGSTDRYIEFYEGFLLAVDSLKNLGMSFEVQALESGIDAETLLNQLESGKVEGSDYCLGGVNSEQITVLSEWSKKHKMYTILPFSSRIPEIDTNPYLIQTLTSQSFLFNRLSEYAPELVAGTNLIFLGSSTNESDSRVQFQNLIKKTLKAKGVAFKVVEMDETFDLLKKELSNSVMNLIMPVPSSIQETNSFLAQISAFAVANPDYNLALMGYPDWIAVGKSYQQYLYDLNTIMYSSFYADFTKKNVQEFQVRFNQNYGKSMMNIYPKYAMMGYDAAAWFIPRMVREKNNFKAEIPYFEPLQNKFYFDKKSLNSGESNQSIYLIQYTSDNELKVNIIH